MQADQAGSIRRTRDREVVAVLCLVTTLLIAPLATIADPRTMWQRVNPFFAETEEFIGLRFTDRLHGCVVGNNGRIERTSDGGATWITTNVGCPTHSSHFDAVTDALWFAFDGPVLYSTRDGGESWTFRGSFAYKNPSGVSFLDENRGAVVGDMAVHLTTDGGATWHAQAMPPLSSGYYYNLKGIYWVNADTLLAIGAGVGNGANGDSPMIIRSSDGGSTWVTVLDDGQNNDHNYLVSARFFNNSVGIAVGQEIRRTTDGGLTWKRIGGLIDVSQTLRCVACFDSLHWFAAGYGGNLMQSSDGGWTWVRANSPTTQDLNRIQVIDDANAMIVGTAGAVLRTTDRGGTWNVVPRPTVGDLYAVACADTVHAVAVGSEGTIMFTADGGDTWGSAASGTQAALRSVCTLDSLRFVATGDSGSILLSTDGGSTWRGQQSGTVLPLRSVDAADENKVVAVGDRGTVLASGDGGAHWTQVEDSITDQLLAVRFSSATEGTAVGLNNVLLRSHDGGATWRNVATGTGHPCSALVFLDSLVGVIAGRDSSWEQLSSRYGLWVYENQFVFTTDAGNTWRDGPRTGSPNSLSRRDSHTIVTTAEAGSVAVSTDSGSTWRHDSTNTTVTLYGIAFCSGRRGYAVGAGGTILCQLDDGPRSVNHSPDTLVFPETATNGVRLDSVVLQNSTASPLNVNISLLQGADFVGDSHIVHLSPGGSGALRVWFHPQAAGQHQGRLAWTIDRFTNHDTVVLQGVATGPGITLTPLHIEFTLVTETTSKTAVVTISNSGNDTLRVAAITSTDPHFVADAGSLTVSPGERRDVRVTFTPAALQPYSAFLVFVHNAGGGADTVTMTATVISRIDPASASAPRELQLSGAYPNPVSRGRGEAAHWDMTIGGASPVTLTISDLAGRRVADMFKGTLEPGRYKVSSSVASIPAGTYVVTLSSGRERVSQMLTIR